MNEADIQVLASIRRAEAEGVACDRATIERNEERYWMYLEDWSESWQSLLDAGLIQGDENGYSLTGSGRPLAEHYFAERPDYFWYYYQHYYPAANASIAHSKLCERVFGRDLTQDGQADMDSINDLIAHLEIGENNKVLDLGCGAGGISEYMSDQTGAHITGLDYAVTAIETAAKRTNGKQDRLAFVRGDMNALDFADSTFDAVVAVDTIYWVANLDEALASISRLLKPGGRLAIFVAITPAMGNSPATYVPNGNWVAKALTKRGLDYDVHDYTETFLNHWPKLKEAVLELKDDFIAEGNEAMVDSFMLDADEDYLPAAEAGKLRRYLYIART
jgi:ubiquinone/menaquinone biosynthesis C-methylase UbiE